MSKGMLNGFQQCLSLQASGFSPWWRSDVHSQVSSLYQSHFGEHDACSQAHGVALPRPSKLLPLMPRKSRYEGIANRDQTSLGIRTYLFRHAGTSHLTDVFTSRKPAMISWQLSSRFLAAIVVQIFLCGFCFLCCQDSFQHHSRCSERFYPDAGSAFRLVTELFLSGVARIFFLVTRPSGRVCMLRYSKHRSRPRAFFGKAPLSCGFDLNPKRA